MFAGGLLGVSGGRVCTMLGKFVKMDELSRQLDLREARRGRVEKSLQQVGSRPLAGEKKSGVAAQAVLEELVMVTLSDVEHCGVRLDQRTELVKLAQPLLDEGLSVAEVQAALETFIKHKQWSPLSRVTLEGIVNSAIDALVDAEMAEDTALEAGRLVPEADELHEVSLATVTSAPVRWLWPGKIPLGKVTVIYGEAGLGKTCLALDLAARVSAGAKFLDATSAPEAGQVLIVNGEDSLVDGICPRLEGGGANLQNISVIAGMKSGSSHGSPAAAASERSFDLGRDLPVLRKRIAASGQMRLLIIDPLEAYLGKGGASRTRLRAVMAELTKLAAETGVAVVVISSSTKCDLPVKNVWRVDCDVLEAGVRYWVPVRYHYGPLPDGLAFRVTAAGIAWEARPQGPTADQGRGASTKQERCVQLQEHAGWLRQYLASGSRPARQVLKSAVAAGLSVSQLKRAKQALGIRCYKEPVPKGRWIWEG